LKDRSRQIDDALDLLPKQLTGKEIVALLLTVSNAYAASPMEAIRYLVMASLVMANEMKMPEARLKVLTESLKSALEDDEPSKPYLN